MSYGCTSVDAYAKSTVAVVVECKMVNGYASEEVILESDNNNIQYHSIIVTTARIRAEMVYRSRINKGNRSYDEDSIDHGISGIHSHTFVF